MTIKENVTVFHCDHCTKKLFVEHAMVKHEKYCGGNPENKRACSLCDYMKRKPLEYYYDTYEGEQSDTTNGFYCEKFCNFIYPPFIEDKVWFTNNPEQFEEQEPFKRECEHYTLGGQLLGIEGTK